MINCILPQTMKEFRQGIAKEGHTFTSIRKLTSAERTALFAKYFNTFEGDTTARDLNNQYERKMLLPNQREALMEWANKTKKEGVKGTRNHQNLYDRIANMEGVYNPREGKPFLNGLAEAQLGFAISREDAQAVYKEARTAQAMKKELDRLTGKPWETLTEAEFKKIPDSTMDKALDLGRQISKLQDSLETAYFARVEPTFLDKLAGTFTMLRASWDVSFGRQLLKSYYGTAFDPRFKGKQAGWYNGLKSWNKENAETFKAAMYAHPYYLSGKLDAIGVRLGGQESEFFPKNFITNEAGQAVLQKTKAGRGITHLFDASERAYETGVKWRQFEIAVALIDANNGNIEMLKAMDIGNAINGMVGKVDIPLIGKDKQGKLTRVFFAPRWVASQVRNLTDLRFNANFIGSKLGIKGVEYNQAQQLRLRAANYNILTTAIMSSIITATIKALTDGDDSDDDFWDYLVDVLDPRATDFGKLVIGDLRLDLSVGTNSIISMFSKVLTGQKKTGAGLIREQNRLEAAYQWLKYKESPLFRFIQDGYKVAGANINAGLTAIDAKPSWVDKYLPADATDVIGQPMPGWKFFLDSVLPISVQNVIEGAVNIADGQNSLGQISSMVAMVLADIIGINSNYYQADSYYTDQGRSRELTKEQIKIARAHPDKNDLSGRLPTISPSKSAKIHENPEAVKEYERLVLERWEAQIKTPKWKSLTPAERKKAQADVKKGVMKEVKKKYGIK